MPILKADALKYFQDVRAHFAAYHNHKETSAWAAVAVYLAITLQIAGGATSPAAVEERIARSLTVGLLAIAMAIYVSFQLARRKNAADYVAASLAIIIEYLPIVDGPIPNEDAFRLVPSTDYDHQSPHVLPKIILEKANELKDKGQATLKNLERTMYFSVSAVTLVAMALIWFK
jgi:hypothetical protein